MNVVARHAPEAWTPAQTLPTLPFFVYWLKRVRRRARGRASSAMPGGRGASGDSGIGHDCTRGPPHPRAFYRCPVLGGRRHGDHSGNRPRSRTERREQRVAKILGVSVEGRSSLRHTSLSACIRAGSSVLSGRGWSVNTGGHALNPSSISVFNGL